MKINKRYVGGVLAAVCALTSTVLFQNCSPGFSSAPGWSNSSESTSGESDPHIDKVVLLMHFTGANGSSTFADATGRHPNATVIGNARVISSQSVFGGGSLYLDGNSYLSLPPSIDWNLNEGDATVEAWINPMEYTSCPGTPGGNCQLGILAQGSHSADGDWHISIFKDAPFGLYAGISGHDLSSVYSGLPALSAFYNRWNHIAFSKTGGTTRIFLNGTQVASAPVNPFSGSPKPLFIGGTETAVGFGRVFRGYMNDLRITKGVGRYTANFTPVEASFPNPASPITPPSNPVNAWRPLVQGTNAPGARAYHTAVWTGSKMIVWGGDGSPNAPLIYDPVSQTWGNPGSTVGAPGARFGHSAIWTGKKMIIWGGAEYQPGQPASTGARHNDGAAYDPVTDTWSPIAASPLSPRFLHSAVWTGSKMIVWGGTLDQIRENPATDAAMYDPTSNSWSMISMTGSPSGRYMHSAVWTGDRMIIYGGTLNGVGNFGNMAAYNPANNSWSTITAANTPSARGQMTTVWTGSKMIVWTGYSAPNATPLNGYINEAFAYDPVQNSWTMLSVTGAPLARRQATAVWTGNAMIVWSGIDAENLTAPDPGKKVNDGGVYYP